MPTRRYEHTVQLDSGLIIPASAAAGKVLTSDASGNATWQTAAAASVKDSWTTLYQARSSFPTSGAAGTYIQRVDATASSLSSGNQTSGSTLLRLDPTTDYALSGTTIQIRLVHTLITQSALTNVLTPGLYPFTSKSALVWTIGTVVAGTTSVFTNQAADTVTTIATAAMTMPATGNYVLGCVTSAAMGATGTAIPWLQTLLQIRAT